jgi:hypothetical protein
MSHVSYDPNEIQFVEGQRGSRLLSLGGYNFVKNRATDEKTYWICSRKVREWGTLHQPPN